MCYDDKAIPPNPPGETGQAQGEDLVLTAADGNRFAAYYARPARPGGAQVLIYPDIRGLHQFYKTLALRFAEIGITALTFDYFGRTAGLTTRDDGFEFRPHVQQIQPETVFADVTASLAYLHMIAPEQSTFVIGFCLGGSLAFLTGAHEELNLAGVVSFYAGLSRKMGDATILESVTSMRYPVLALYGGADAGIPVEQVRDLEDALEQAGVEHTVFIYPGAPHSFFDKRAADYAEASADAWKKVLHFISSHVEKV